MTRSAIANALSVRFGGSWPRFSFQLHRSAGFFCAPLLLFMGFSGVHFNMPAWVAPIVGAVATVTPNGKPVNRSAAGLPPLSVAEAVAAAQARYPQARVGARQLPGRGRPALGSAGAPAGRAAPGAGRDAHQHRRPRRHRAARGRPAARARRRPLPRRAVPAAQRRGLRHGGEGLHQPPGPDAAGVLRDRDAWCG